MVTMQQGESQWHVDWLEITYPVGTPLGSLIPGVGESEWEAKDHGRLGYKRAFQARGAEALLGGTDEMGVHLTLGGTSIRYLCDTFGTPTLEQLLARVACGAASVSRVDFAIDTASEAITRTRISNAWQAGHATSRWEACLWVQGGTKGSAECDGWTVYFGSATSDARCRIYDKAAERRAKGKREEALARQMPVGWVRIEYQLRNDVAAAAIRLYQAEGSAALAAAFLGYLAFRDPGPGSRVERWGISQWWSDVIGTVETRPMKVPRPDGDLATTHAWLVQQAAPSLAALTLAAGGDVSVAKDIALAGVSRLSPKLVARLTRAGVLDVNGDATWQGVRRDESSDVAQGQTQSQDSRAAPTTSRSPSVKVVPLDTTTLRPKAGEQA